MNFVTLNASMKTSAHLLCNLDKYPRSICSQLRLGCLPIEVETGRYAKVPKAERVCKLCSEGVKNEIHFLFDCIKTQNQRILLYHKLPELLNCDNKVKRMEQLFMKPFIASKYVTDLWNHRTSLIKHMCYNL